MSKTELGDALGVTFQQIQKYELGKNAVASTRIAACAGHLRCPNDLFGVSSKIDSEAISRCNDVGLLAEELDPLAGRMLGNFPQAYSHVGLINCALNLSRQTGPARSGLNRRAAVPPFLSPPPCEFSHV